MEYILTVDEKDNAIGTEEKEKCHYREPCLHRAFSILIFNSKGQMLIQKRSNKKKTWPGFWSNACCSSPQKAEEEVDSAKKRLKHELGFSCDLKFLFKFRYKAKYNEEWSENEIDWVFKGSYDGSVKPNKDEVEEFKFVDVEDLKKDAKNHPEKYSPWFLIILKKLYRIETKIDAEWGMMK
jgi:isopentenyl-diphosphate delta-isomerase